MTRLTSHRGHEIRVISNPFAPARRCGGDVTSLSILLSIACWGAIIAFTIYVAATVARAMA